jgi:hypothetical protein
VPAGAVGSYRTAMPSPAESRIFLYLVELVGKIKYPGNG